MRRVACLAAVAGACCALAAPAAGLHARASVSLTDCDVPPTGAPAERTATFTGRMRPVAGTARMAMRFRLLERLGRGRYRRVRVPGLGRWRSSEADVRAFVYDQKVRGLKVGAAYRARVRFAWYDGAGRTLLRTSRLSNVCGGGPLPNLAIANLTTRPGPTADTRLYEVAVTNRGRAPVGGALVLLRVDRSPVDAARLARLRPGRTRVLTFTGPACRSRVEVSVDPRNVIGESRESDNVRRIAC